MSKKKNQLKRTTKVVAPIGVKASDGVFFFSSFSPFGGRGSLGYDRGNSIHVKKKKKKAGEKLISDTDAPAAQFIFFLLLSCCATSR